MAALDLRRACMLVAVVGVGLLAAGCTVGPSRREVPEGRMSLKGTARQFGRGLTNLGLCWLEIPYQVEKQVAGSRIEHPFDAVGSTLNGAVGVVNGAIWGVGRGVGGVFEIILSPFPPYEPIVRPAYPPYVRPAEKPEPETAEPEAAPSE